MESTVTRTFFALPFSPVDENKFAFCIFFIRPTPKHDIRKVAREVGKEISNRNKRQLKSRF